MALPAAIMLVEPIEGATSISERLERLVARWWELAGVGYPRDRTNQVSWAEHIQRLLAEPEKRDGESKNDPALDAHPPRHEDWERQLTRDSLDAEGLGSFLAFLSQRR